MGTFHPSGWLRERCLIQARSMRLPPRTLDRSVGKDVFVFFPTGIANVVLCKAEVYGDQESLPENEANREEKETIDEGSK